MFDRYQYHITGLNKNKQTVTWTLLAGSADEAETKWRMIHGQDHAFLYVTEGKRVY